MARDIYQEVTDRIIKALEEGVVPWSQPWVGGADLSATRNGDSDRAYNGINILLLWMTAIERGYKDPRWMTFRQIKKAGLRLKPGQNRKMGAGGTQIIFWNWLKRKDKTTGEDYTFPLLKTYTVFNSDQVEGGMGEVVAEEVELPGTVKSDGDRYAEVYDMIAESGANIVTTGNRACYRPSSQDINMPSIERFESEEAYVATLLHELAHWTGHEDRLGRDMTGSFGSTKYGREELVAEMSAAFMTTRYNIKNKTRHESYIASWLRLLKEDKRAIFTAASQAKKVVEFLTEPAVVKGMGLDHEIQKAA